MSFVHPLALLGLAAAAIPALLHLLHRRTPPELDFPALRYLSEAERQSARRLKLRHLLLLILRTALIVAIVLAAARPLVPVTRGGGSAHEPTALVVILDNSPSSGAVVDGRPVLDRLRAVARGSLTRATSADRVWLMLADGIVRGGSRETLLASVDSATPAWRRLDLVDAVERAARLVHAEPLPGASGAGTGGREVHVLSDLQATALAAGRAAVPAGVQVLATAPGAPVPNRGIADVVVAEGAALVTVTGGGPGGAEPVPVTVRVGTYEQRALVTPGEAGERTAVAVALPSRDVPGGGWWSGEAFLAPDELRADDRRPFVWRIAPLARVAAGAGVGTFLRAALDVLREGGRIRGAGGAGGAGADVAIGDVAAPGDGRAIVQPPADAALLGQANRALGARGAPWRWAAGGATATPGPIAVAGAGESLDRIAGTQVIRRYRIERTTAPAGSGASPDAEPAADVLATVNGEPWLVRAGALVLLGSRLDTAWTALPTTPGFVPFVDALVNRVVAGEAEVARAEGAPRVAFALQGGDTIGATVFGPDPRESDLTPARAAAITDALGGDDRVRVLADDRFAAARFAGMRRADLAGLLLVFALVLAAAELGVATLTR